MKRIKSTQITLLTIIGFFKIEKGNIFQAIHRFLIVGSLIEIRFYSECTTFVDVNNSTMILQTCTKDKLL